MNAAYFREATQDYRIEINGGSIYIKPQGKKLRIATVGIKTEKTLTALIGEPTGRESPETMNAAVWDIWRD